MKSKMWFEELVYYNYKWPKSALEHQKNSVPSNLASRTCISHTAHDSIYTKAPEFKAEHFM